MNEWRLLDLVSATAAKKKGMTGNGMKQGMQDYIMCIPLPKRETTPCFMFTAKAYPCVWRASLHMRPATLSSLSNMSVL